VNAPLHPDPLKTEREDGRAQMSHEMRAELADELRASMKASAWAISHRVNTIADALDLRDDGLLAYSIGCTAAEMKAMTNALRNLLSLKDGEHG
jgi:hypothetical protein